MDGNASSDSRIRRQKLAVPPLLNGWDVDARRTISRSVNGSVNQMKNTKKNPI